ncbi:general odorant-binding protein 56d-like [Pseudomyrmex gracilis]|uniref:general odorant-binding protein 56d-like n=1 Tax=Pseudomyrmex gracilis TaxID=219809 RepID=UPI000995B15F|nr:general odorant-binding protein 56d-like [Pseudomyrmex gracilis]
MKAIVIAFTVFLVAALGSAQITDEQKAKLARAKEICIAETGADAAAIQSVIRGEPVESEKLACFSQCLLKKIHVLNEDDTLNVDFLRAHAPKNVPQEEIEDVIAKCRDVSGTGCEKGGNIMKCFLQNKKFNVLS